MKNNLKKSLKKGIIVAGVAAMGIQVTGGVTNVVDVHAARTPIKNKDRGNYNVRPEYSDNLYKVKKRVELYWDGKNVGHLNANELVFGKEFDGYLFINLYDKKHNYIGRCNADLNYLTRVGNGESDQSKITEVTAIKDSIPVYSFDDYRFNSSHWTIRKGESISVDKNISITVNGEKRYACYGQTNYWYYYSETEANGSYVVPALEWVAANAFN